MHAGFPGKGLGRPLRAGDVGCCRYVVLQALRLNSLRHLAITSLVIGERVPIGIVSQIAVHAYIAITYNNYTYPITEDAEQLLREHEERMLRERRGASSGQAEPVRESDSTRDAVRQSRGRRRSSRSHLRVSRSLSRAASRTSESRSLSPRFTAWSFTNRMCW